MKDSKIQWTDHTFNPWEGCTKVSPGCANCYAEDRDKRWHNGEHWGKGAPRRRTSEANWRKPVAWNNAVIAGRISNDNASEWPARPRVFSASLGDWLDPEVPVEWLSDFLELIQETPNLDWLLLTKRPELWQERMNAVRQRPNLVWEWLAKWSVDGIAPHNVWIGTTVEDQKRADERIPALLDIPAKVRFLSVEPMLEQIDLAAFLGHCPDITGDQMVSYNMGISWVICGGESGREARTFCLHWARNLRDRCKAAEVPFFMKQLGSKANVISLEITGKGGDPDEWPEDLRIREFPKS